MAHFTAGVALAVVILTAADPTLRPSTPPTQRPTAPSPRPTSSTPQPTDLIRILGDCSGDVDAFVKAPAGYGQEPVFDTPATGQIDQPVSAGYGHGVPTATPVASAPPVEQSSGWTWSKATPAQQANRFNMCL